MEFAKTRRLLTILSDVLYSIAQEVIFSIMASLLQTSKKLMKALNSRGFIVTYGRREFMGRDNTIHNMNMLYLLSYNEEKHKYESTPIYSTPSQVRLVMYLRDFWYIIEGKELPTDQELWNKLRQKLIDEGNYIYGQYRS